MSNFSKNFIHVVSVLHTHKTGVKDLEIFITPVRVVFYEHTIITLISIRKASILVILAIDRRQRTVKANVIFENLPQQPLVVTLIALMGYGFNKSTCHQGDDSFIVSVHLLPS